MTMKVRGAPSVNQADAFVQDIVAHPEDDAPRLIFADWLEEQGDSASHARAELIRVQYALAELPAGDLRRPPLEQRQRDLLLAHEEQWTAPLRELGIPAWQFRRGFVERIRVHPARLIQCAAALQALVPLRELELTSEVNHDDYVPVLDLEAVALLPLLEQITALDLDRLHLYSYSEIRGSLPALLHSPRLGRLTTLSIPQPGILPTLLQAPFLPRLRTLRCTYNLATFFQKANLAGLTRLEFHEANWPLDDPLAGVACSPHLEQFEELSLATTDVPSALDRLASLRLPHLRYLDLSRTGLDGKDLRALLSGPLLEPVLVLDMGGNSIGEAGAKRLARAGCLSQLQRLVLNGNRLGPGGAAALSHCQNLAALEALHLRTNAIGDDGLQALAGNHLLRLRELNVSYNGVTARGLYHLASAWPGRLASLDLSWNRFGDDGVQALASCPDLTSLTALDLSYCELNDRAAVALAECPGLVKLATLNLDTNRIGDDGLATLAHSPHLGALRSLHLRNTAVGDEGVRALLDSPLLGKLEVLVLGGSRVSEAMRQELRSAFRGILG
jgi:uncharacterized protein (TIGR02996 family)